MCPRLIHVLAFLLVAFTSAKAQNCTELSASEWEDIQGYAQNIIPIILFKLPSVANDTQRQASLDSLKILDYTAYTSLLKSVNGFIGNTTPEQQTCFYHLSQNNVIGDWIGFIYRQEAPEIKGLSPEFRKGWGILAELNQGALNPFQGGERYFLSIKGLLAYTFAKEIAGGRIRALLGPSLHYSSHNTQLLLTTRLEVRLMDIRADPVSLGAIKFIGEENTDLDGLWIVGTGIGVELPNFGIQALYEWETESNINHFEIGISYRFLN